MKQAKITYEALGDTLLIHMPKELDHHNCRTSKRIRTPMLDEKLYQPHYLRFWKNRIYGLFRDWGLIKPL